MADKKKKKQKLCADGSELDRLSQLPESLISEILGHLPTKDAVRTSVLSTKWKHHWRNVRGLDLDINTFPDSNAFVSFAERFIHSHNESWITKLRLYMQFSYYRQDTFCIAPWIESLSKIQHLDVEASYIVDAKMPLSLYTCATLVHLRLRLATLPNAEFVYLPCLKIMLLEYNQYPDEATLEKLISGSPILEDLSICGVPLQGHDPKVIQVRSQTLTRLYVDYFGVEIDAPLLKCFKTKIGPKKKFKIKNLGLSTRLDVEAGCCFGALTESLIRDILTDISKVKDLVVNDVMWKDIFLYNAKSTPLIQFRHLSRLDTKFSTFDLEMLPAILESCPLLESFVLELVKSFRRHRNRETPKAMFTTVPKCLVSSLKFVELKRSISKYEGEMELVRYFLKNSRNLEKLKLRINIPKKSESALLKELLAMRRCSTACEVLVV